MKEHTLIFNPKKLLQSNINSIIKSQDINPENKELILNFQNHCISKGLSFFRTSKYLTQLKTITKRINKPLKTTTKEDIEGFLNWLQRSDYAENTKSDFKTALRVFFFWLKKEPLVNWFSTKKRNGNNTLPDQLLTIEDVLKLSNASKNTRDKAFIISLYESGCRIGELGSLKIKHLNFDDNGCTINVNGKTGPRRIRLISSTSHLANWLNQHPQKENKESPFWIKFEDNKKPIEYAGLAKILKTTAKRIKFQKPVNPHHFRHSRATELAKHLTEAQLKQYFGWTQASNMASRYVHLSGRDLDNKLLELHGIKQVTERQEEKLMPKKCQNCNKINENNAIICIQCHKPLDLETALRLEEEKELKHELQLKEMQEKMLLIEEFMKSNIKNNTQHNTTTRR